MTRSWLEPVQADVELLRQSAASLEGGSVEERQRNFENKASDIRGRARNIAARSSELGKSTAAEMRALAATVSVPPEKPGFSCYDPTLAQRLTQAADQAEQPAELKLREAVFNEGPAGVANAVKNLWKNIGTYTSSLVSYVFSGGTTVRHTEQGEPITGRDLIALLGHHRRRPRPACACDPQPAAGRAPPLEPDDREGNPRRHPHRAGPRRRRHRMGAPPFHLPPHGVLPRHPEPLQLRSQQQGRGGQGPRHEPVRGRAGRPRRRRMAGCRQAQAGPASSSSKSELQKLKREESLPSDTDLTKMRQKWLEESGQTGDAAKSETNQKVLDAKPIRNHGLFSKAENAPCPWLDGASRRVATWKSCG